MVVLVGARGQVGAAVAGDVVQLDRGADLVVRLQGTGHARGALVEGQGARGDDAAGAAAQDEHPAGPRHPVDGLAGHADGQVEVAVPVDVAEVHGVPEPVVALAHAGDAGGALVDAGGPGGVEAAGGAVGDPHQAADRPVRGLPAVARLTGGGAADDVRVAVPVDVRDGRVHAWPELLVALGPQPGGAAEEEEVVGVRVGLALLVAVDHQVGGAVRVEVARRERVAPPVVGARGGVREHQGALAGEPGGGAPQQGDHAGLAVAGGVLPRGAHGEVVVPVAVEVAVGQVPAEAVEPLRRPGDAGAVLPDHRAPGGRDAAAGAVQDDELPDPVFTGDVRAVGGGGDVALPVAVEVGTVDGGRVGGRGGGRRGEGEQPAGEGCRGGGRECGACSPVHR